MDNYSLIRFTNYTDAANMYTDGTKVVTGSTNGRYSVVSRTDYTSYMALISTGTIMIYVYGVYNLKIGITSKQDNADAVTRLSTEITSWTTAGDISYYLYDTNDTFTSADITIFNTLEEAIDAIVNPIYNPGVHVQFNPIYTPHYDGVNVIFSPVLVDPNAQGGTSITGGGDGTFDETSDAIPVPNLPDISVVNTGLVTLFRPTQQEVAALGSYLWTNFRDFIENLQKLFTNPMDYFIAFNIFPVSPLVTNAREIYIGNWATNISMPPVANQWYEFDCGTVTLQKYWGSALDYAPNTKVQLMLPYIGSVQLNTDEVMGQQIGVKYRIDLLSGSCVAMVTVNGNVYYQFTGECAVAVPLTGADWSRIYSAVVGAVGTAIAGGVGVAAAGAVGGTGGLVAARSYEAAAAGGAAWASINETSKGVRGVAEMRQRMLDVSNAAMENARNAASKSVRRSEGVRNMRLANTVNNTVGQVMGAKSAISHSGTISGSAGMLGVRDAYLIVEYPNQSLAKDYKHFVGYPSNMYARLGTLSGYTEVEQVIPEGIWGTDDELAELIESLKGGVYL